MPDDTFLSSGRSSKIARSPSGANSSDLDTRATDADPASMALSFDADEFIQYVKDHELSEAEAYEFLATIWVYVVTWVDLGFGIHPAQQTHSKSGTNSKPALDHESALVLTCRETFNNRTNAKTVQRPKRRADRRDS